MRTNIMRSIAVIALAGIAAAQSLTGTVTDPLGNPLAGIVIQMSNGGGSGQTNASGVFTITGLSNRNYATVDIISPLAHPTGPWTSIELIDVGVSGATTIGPIILQPGAIVSGTVTSQTGTGAVGGNMNVYDRAGAKRFTPNDAIAVGGVFSIVVPLGYNVVRAVPVVGSGLVPKDWELLDVTGPVSLTGTLVQGYVVTGSVVDIVSGVPIAGAKIKTFDQASGDIIGQQVDTTNAFGQFTLLMPYGMSDWEVYSPAFNPHVPKQLIGVPTIRAFSTGSIRLQRAVVVTGTVAGPGGPVAGADIDVYDANQHKLWTPRDNSNAAGGFSLNLAAGSYRITAQPQVATGLASASTAQLNISLNTNVGTLSCVPGVAFSGRILYQGGAPAGGGDIDVVDPGTGQRLIIAGGHADAAGNFSTVVPAGIYNVNATAPQGTTGMPTSFASIDLTAPVVQDLTLGTKSVVLDLTSFFMWSVANGSNLPIRVTFQNVSGSTLPVFFDIVVQYPSGAETPIVIGLPLDLPPMPFPLALGPIWAPVPVIAAPHLGKPIKYLVRYRHRATNAVLDSAYASFVVN